ncbi:MAG: hypothetical protein IV100_04565 [Myxococcales bacterium]|nr:hypothetical protein [Myxococcales bacterium]
MNVRRLLLRGALALQVASCAAQDQTSAPVATTGSSATIQTISAPMQATADFEESTKSAEERPMVEKPASAEPMGDDEAEDIPEPEVAVEAPPPPPPRDTAAARSQGMDALSSALSDELANMPRGGEVGGMAFRGAGPGGGGAESGRISGLGMIEAGGGKNNAHHDRFGDAGLAAARLDDDRSAMQREAKLEEKAESGKRENYRQVVDAQSTTGSGTEVLALGKKGFFEAKEREATESRDGDARDDNFEWDGKPEPQKKRDKVGAKNQQADGDGLIDASGEAEPDSVVETEHEVSRAPTSPEPMEPEEPAPTVFLPDMFYFENTYLGGDAGYRESLRRLDVALADVGAPHRLASLPKQGFDAPEHDGLAVIASVDRTSVEGPGRVFLQVGIRGSERYGWRRPPLELVAVIDLAELAGGVQDAEALVAALLDKLGPQDRLAVVAAGQDQPIATLGSPRQLRSELMPRLARDLAAATGGGDLGGALTRAGLLFAEANKRRTTAPGTQVVLILTGSEAMPTDAMPVVSELTLGGVVTSVIGVAEPGSSVDSGLWQLAAIGHGNAHTARVSEQADVDGSPARASIGAAVDAELELLSRVVARLARLNVRLAPGVKAVRVLGSRPLLAQEVREVKAREVETDRRLSQVLGITADRGDDDDGIQTVIPVFYGGDSHVVVLELWTDGPGPVADVTLRYKDMVNLDNRAARTSVSLRAAARVASDIETTVVKNRGAFEAGDQLKAAATAMRAHDYGVARHLLSTSVLPAARRYGSLVEQVLNGELSAELVSESLELAARRVVGGGG